MRVVGAERNPLVVSALRQMLECDGRFELVNAVQSGKQFLDLAAEAGFDVAVIGWKLADMDGAGRQKKLSGRSLVRSRRLELPRVAPQRPQRCASTNSATTARGRSRNRPARGL